MSDQKSCPNCGHTNRASARFCGKCGFDFATIAAPGGDAGPPVATSPAQKPAAPASAPPEFCPSCGKEVVPGVQFCRHCGAKLSAPVAPPAQPPPVQPPPAAAAPVQAAASTPAKTTTRPDPMPAAQPAPSASQPAQPASQPAPQPAQATGAPPAPARRGIPPWLFLLVGAAIGLLLGAGGLWSFQNFAAPQGAGDAAATPTPAPAEVAPTVAITGTVAPAESTPITNTAPAEVPPGELPASEGDAPAVDAATPITESVPLDASGVQTGTTEP